MMLRWTRVLTLLRHSGTDGWHNRDQQSNLILAVYGRHSGKHYRSPRHVAPTRWRPPRKPNTGLSPVLEHGHITQVHVVP